MSAASSPQATPKPTRRWYQFSLRTLLLLPTVLALVLSGIYSWPYVQRRYILWRLHDYVDKDLQKLRDEEKQQVDGWVRTLVGEESKWRFDPFNPASNWRLHTVDIPQVGRQLYVVRMKMTELGYFFCILHTLDSSGRLVRSTDFPVGYIISPLSVACDETHGFLCLIVETGYKAGTTREFYRIADDHIGLLRVENESGRCQMGRRSYWAFPYSPVERSNWQDRLDSPERLEQLRGLAAYLAGPHRTERIADKVRHRLSELANSSDPWISEEAKVAMAEAENN